MTEWERAYSKRVPSVAFDASVARAKGWPKLAPVALHGLAGDFVRATEPGSEADAAALLIQFLASTGNVIGSGPHCYVEATRHPLLAYPVLVGETARARKGTSWGHVRRFFELVDPEWIRDRVTTGLSSAEGLIEAVRDRGNPVDDKRLLAVQGEFASVLKIMTRDGNTLSTTLRDSWDGGELRTLTRNDPLKATGAHITVIGHITREELRRYLSNTEGHNGFANRFLWVCTERSKLLPEGEVVETERITALAEKFKEVLHWARGQGCFQIKRDEQARKLWAKVYPALSQASPGLLGAATARAEAQVLRLSAIYAVHDCSTVIGVKHLKAALAVWDYCLDSARHIFGNRTGNSDADRIWAALRDADSVGMTRTEIRDLFKRHLPIDRIEQALDELARFGVAKFKSVSTGGRDQEKWYATKATEATESGHL